ncbi:MAG: Hsp20/alpha crystallin family protein [Candidatus Eremiobacteraeota bacterium]|nr:Hsp20/alpha crystallin family protein [Candidatus Eremiobacteraeota bacterium]
MAARRKKDAEKPPQKSILSVGTRMFPFGSTGWGWDPLLGLESVRLTMNGLLASLFPRSRTFFPQQPWEPPLDVYLRKGALVVEAILPGVRKEDVSMHLTSTLLIIDGHVPEAQGVEEKDFITRERNVGRFCRSFPLPCAVVPESLYAEQREGIIRLFLSLEKEE